MKNKPGVLTVGNFDSNVGYAWRLMERLWCELAKHFSKKNYAMYVCFPTISTVPECLSQSGFNVDKLDFSESSPSALMKQCRYLKNNSIEILYLTDKNSSSLKYFLYRLFGVKTIIVHNHTPGLRNKPGALKGWIKSVLHSLPLVSSSASFAVSPYVQKRLIEVNRVPSRKVYCVTNGIDVGPEAPIRSYVDERVTIVTVARANYYKGIDFALYVVKKLADKLGADRVRYTLLGDGPDIEDFKGLAKELQIEGLVTFAGAVDDVPDRLLRCDIALHPSKGEAMSLAILEYMRAGLPVVASDNPSVSSALKHNEYAMIYKEGSIKSATEMLCELIEQPEKRINLGNQARYQLETQFSSEAMSKRFLEAITSVTHH